MLLNRIRANEYMLRYGLDGLIATSPVNVTYFTGYRCWLDSTFKQYMMTPGASSESLMETYALLPREGTPCLIVDSLFAVNAIGLDCSIYGHGEPGYDRNPVAGAGTCVGDFEGSAGGLHFATSADALAAAATSLGLSRTRIGLEKEGLPWRTVRAFAQALAGTKLPDCSNLLRLVRMVKSDEELRRLRKAAEISEEAAHGALVHAAPDVPISELRKRFAECAVRHGAHLDHFAFGLGGFGIATEPEHVLRDEEVLYVDFGCVWKYYLSDSGTTLAVGHLNSVLSQKHRLLRDAIEAGKALVKPGALPSSIHTAMARVAQKYDLQTFPHGHGLGLEARDYPIIVGDSGLRVRDDCVDEPADLPIEAGMVLNLESGVFAPGLASLHTEESLLVTKNAWEPLIPQDRSKPFFVPKDTRGLLPNYAEDANGGR